MPEPATAPDRFEINLNRFRFDSAADALEAARAFEATTLDDLDYAIGFSVGDTTGWAVDVSRAGERSQLLGNLRPVDA